MKINAFYLGLIILCASFINPDDSVVIRHTYYTTTFSKSKHIPILVEFTLTKQMLSCTEHERRTNKFVKDPELADATNLGRDYTHSGYDRGHNMSAQDNECSTTGMKECFYFSNMFPQPHSINAGIWEDLEKHERETATTDDSIEVFIGNIGQAGTIGEDKVVVPEYCWKVIYIYSSHNYEAYKIPNTTVSPGARYSNYSITIEELENEAKIKFQNGKATIEE
jgi:endonuclease G